MLIASYLYISFLALIAVPCAVLAIIFSSKIHGAAKFVGIFLAVIGICLTVGSIVNDIVGMVLIYTYYSSYWRGYIPVNTWIAMALFIAAIVISATALLVALLALRYQKNKNRHSNIARGRSNTNYIEEIKMLKELFDCGAITQEEFTIKKTEILKQR